MSHKLKTNVSVITDGRSGFVSLCLTLSVVSFQSDFTKTSFLICKICLEIGTKRLTYQFRWQTRPLQSNESIVATSSADSSKSKIWAFSIIRDFVTDFGIVILPRCTWNHIDTYILKTSEAIQHVPLLPTTSTIWSLFYVGTVICHFLCGLCHICVACTAIHTQVQRGCSAKWQR